MRESKFVNIGSEKVSVLQRSDPAVGAISRVRQAKKRLTFEWLRRSFGRNRDLWKELGRGLNVLTSTEQLDQYLYSYGLMVECQWQQVGGSWAGQGPVRLVDYGCGQGLAGLLLYDKWGDAFASSLQKVVLIEPSPQALIRAEAVYRSIAPESDIVCLNADFDAVQAAHLEGTPSLHTMHVFSNVLDIEGFDQFRLLGEALEVGTHSIFAVSPDREFQGGTERFSGLKSALEDPSLGDRLIMTHSELIRFKCGQDGKWPVVFWGANLEVAS